jgi:23S rRNA (guanosine2251-2'-O)-methyltransferase
VRGRAGDIAVVMVARDAKPTVRGLLGEATQRGVRIEERDRAELDALADDVRHQGVVAIAGAYPYASVEDIVSDAGPRPLVVALDQITDPHNFGAIVRSCVAFGADGVVTLERRAAPVTPVVVRASAGATERARIARVTNLARALHDLADRGFSIVGLDAGGEVSIDGLPDAPHGRVLVVGSEGRGLRRLVRERCDLLARIEMAGPLGSLNASVAAAIALFAVTRG